MKQNFPSYNRIATKIAHQQRKQYLDYIAQIDQKVASLKASIDYDAEHRDLIKKMIAAHHRDTGFQDAPHSDPLDLGVFVNKAHTHNAESLNEYLEDSDEDQDNFEAHLKFRKKALERELELGGGKGREISKSKTKMPEISEEDKLYRDLFNNEQQKINRRRQSRREKRKSGQMEKTNVETLEKNKKKLTELYGPYLQALSQTNMVKWRILS